MSKSAMDIANLINPYDEKFHKGDAVQKPLPQIRENTIMTVKREIDVDNDPREFVTVDKLYDIWNFQKVSKNTDTIIQTLSPTIPNAVQEEKIIENEDDASLIIVIICALILMYVFYIFFNLNTNKRKPLPAKIARATRPIQTKITSTAYNIPTPIVN